MLGLALLGLALACDGVQILAFFVVVLLLIPTTSIVAQVKLDEFGSRSTAQGRDDHGKIGQIAVVLSE